MIFCVPMVPKHSAQYFNSEPQQQHKLKAIFSTFWGHEFMLDVLHQAAKLRTLKIDTWTCAVYFDTKGALDMTWSNKVKWQLEKLKVLVLQVSSLLLFYTQLKNLYDVKKQLLRWNMNSILSIKRELLLFIEVFHMSNCKYHKFT